jgi:hypothetical protein
MILNREDNKSLLVVAFVVLLTRIPFLFAGFGSEEDAWGLILVARNINLSGIYEVSRMPGHPVQEYLLSLIWHWPVWLLNFLTAIVSSLGVFFFMKTLVKLKIQNVIPAGIALAFVPVFFIHSTNIMDYTWALSLVLFAFYLTITGNYLWAGVVIGIACGFRVTAGAMVIPFAIWHYMNHKSMKAVFLSGMLALVTAIICFIPAFKVYGSSFFTYYEYFPYPPMLKNIYKGTVGAWGLFGTAAVAVAAAVFVYRWLKLSSAAKKNLMPIVLVCISTIALYSYSFLRIPQKTAFVLPMAPFIIILVALLFTKKEIVAFASALLISCFFFGINLDDPLRGSEASKLSIRTSIGNVPVAIDALSGLVTADYSKRIQKMKYASGVVDQLASTKEKTVIIAGWWQNELNYFALKKPNPLVTYLYYANKSQLEDSIASGNKIYFLPEQNYFNDLRFDDGFTNELAEPFNIYRF